MFVIIIATILLKSLVTAEDYVHSPIQYQSQTDSGTYNFGYDTGLFGSHQFHQEYKDDSGQVRGRYGYTDPFGKLRLVHYTSGPQGYEVVSDTEADKTPKTSGRSPPDPVITNVIERYNSPPKAISKPLYAKPLYTKPAPLPTPSKLLVSPPVITTPHVHNRNERVSTYLAGRDYGEVIVPVPTISGRSIQGSVPVPTISGRSIQGPVPVPTISGRSIQSPVERLRAAALVSRSADGNRVNRSIAPDRYKPEFNTPEGYTKCTCV
jgi:hypothetical protein